MNFDELIRKNRSYRRFFQDEAISLKTLRELADFARLSASSGNIQGVRLFLSVDTNQNAAIFTHLRWAFYLKDWEGPSEGERPSAYMVILWDKDIKDPVDTDIGIAAQSILLGAVSKGLGGCLIGSVDRIGLRKSLTIPDNLHIALVVALGKPGEQVIIDELEEDRVEYWRDDMGRHHVPKRKLNDMVFTVF